MREGLRLLADEHRIERRVGAGSFTHTFPSRHSSDRLLDFTNPAQDLLIQSTADVIGFRLWDHIPQPLQETFAFSPLSTAIAVFERLSVHAGQVRGLHTYFLPLHDGESLDAADAGGDIYELIETRFLRNVHSAVRAVSAVAADASSAEWLHVRVGSPLLFTESIVRGDDGEVLLVGYARHRHDRLTVTFAAERVHRVS
ncbi:MAG: GntR family transcriptional regulator [Frankiaceae bacterium]|nr:GntR family transcriptional regulator [Frankiaceae bacterium]